MDFVSVERVVELLDLEQEPAGHVDPPAFWPSAGDIVFENVTIRYAPQYDPSLTEVSLCIPGGSTTALLGRTGMLSVIQSLSIIIPELSLGSGKTTLVLALLAISKYCNPSSEALGIAPSEIRLRILFEGGQRWMPILTFC